MITPEQFIGDKRWGIFVDREKEPFGKGLQTIFVYDPKQDEIGNVAGADRGSPLVTLYDVKALGKRFEAQQVYIGARHTEVSPDVIPWFTSTGWSIVFETTQVDVANAVARKWKRNVTVILRGAGYESVALPGVVRKHADLDTRKLRFTIEQEIWKDDTEVSGTELFARAQRMKEKPFGLKDILDRDFTEWTTEELEEAIAMREDAWQFDTSKYEARRRNALRTVVHSLQPKAQSILDVGCHEGHVLYSILYGFHIPAVGLDVSPTALRRALNRNGGQIGVRQFDANEFSKRSFDSSFIDKADIVLAAEMLYYLKPAEAWEAAGYEDWRATVLDNLCSLSSRYVVVQHASPIAHPINRALREQGFRCVDPLFQIWVKDVR